MVVTNTIATTSTVTSSHTILGSVTSIGPHNNEKNWWAKTFHPMEDWLVGSYGISTIVGLLMPNPLNTFVKYV